MGVLLIRWGDRHSTSGEGGGGRGAKYPYTAGSPGLQVIRAPVRTRSRSSSAPPLAPSAEEGGATDWGHELRSQTLDTGGNQWPC